MARPSDYDEIISSSETYFSGSQSETTENIIYPVYLIKRNRKKQLSFRRSPTPRVIAKDGTFLVHRARRSLVVLKYLHDLSNTVLNSNWRWTLIAFSITFLFTWLLFACFWMMLSLNNGDLDDDWRNNQSEPCLRGIQSFAGYFLFSIESQTSIGFGTRYVTDHCPEAAVLLCIQITSGIAVSGLLVGIVFQKLRGAKKSRKCFSKMATICQRDGELCLMFRVRDHDGRYQCHNEIKAYLVKKRGDEVFLKSIKLEPMGMLLWPVEVVHRITPESPLWDLSARDLITKRFEIIVAMEGASLSTCNTSTTSASYINQEILWGRSFVPCVSYDNENRCYFVNHKFFNSTREILTPLCSAKRLQEVFREISSSAPSSTPNYCDSNFTDSPCLSGDTSSRGISSNNGNPDGDVISAEVTVHSQDDANETLNCGKTESDDLLAGLQQFLMNGSPKEKYSETDL